MKFILWGTITDPENFSEYVSRAERTLADHAPGASGYAGAEILARYYSIGERMFFSICEADSGEAVMKVVTPYLDLCDIKAIPVLDGDDTLPIWLNSR
jgi:hypothetical protein